MKRNHPLLSGPYLIWTAAFIIIPLLMIVYYGLTDASGAFTWSNVAQMGTPERLKALVLSLILSLIATAVCLIMAYPLALILTMMLVLPGMVVADAPTDLDEEAVAMDGGELDIAFDEAECGKPENAEERAYGSCRMISLKNGETRVQMGGRSCLAILWKL